MHFYDKEGKPKHFVQMAKDPSRTRPTRVTDAKKNGWLPSVTTVLGILDKPALVNWKVDQHLDRAFSVDASKYPDLESYTAAVKRFTRDMMDQAPNAGTEVHNAIEQYLKTGNYEGPHQGICADVFEMLYQLGEGWKAEKRFAHPLGYAGMVDVHNNKWVIDFKTKQFAEKFKPGKMAYPEHAAQLVAYKYGLELPQARCANIFICIENGKLDFYEHNELTLEREWEVFKSALNVWQHRNYDTQFQEAA